MFFDLEIKYLKFAIAEIKFLKVHAGLDIILEGFKNINVTDLTSNNAFNVGSIEVSGNASLSFKITKALQFLGVVQLLKYDKAML